MSKNIEKFPMLEIVPKEDNNSFHLLLRKDWNTDAEYVGEVTNIKWCMDGPKPDWLMTHKQSRAPEKERGFVPSPGFSKSRLIDEAAVFFFKDKEFTTQELFDVIKELYPTYPLTVTGIGIHLSKKKSKYSRKLVGRNVRVWKCVIPPTN